jgi:uncharacterized protein
MQRLVKMLNSDTGVVEVEIEFGTDQGRIPFLKGQAKTRVELTCQRCMESFSQDLEARFNLGLVRGESQMQALPKEYDPLQVTEEPMSVYEIVEDELIISLPIVAMHDIKICPAADVLESLGKGKQSPDATDKENPFSVLEKLKTH